MTNEPGGRSPHTLDPGVVRGAAQILTMVPHLLGYHPDHAVVVMAIQVDADSGAVVRGHVSGTLRLDLPPVRGLPQLAGVLGDPLRRRQLSLGGRHTLHAFCYDLPEEDGEVEEGYAAALLGALELVAVRAGMELHDVLHVRDGGREARTVVGATHRLDRPWERVPGPGEVPAVADMVLSGSAPLASRAEVVARIRRRDETASAATDLALDLLVADPSRLDQHEAIAALGRWVIEGAPDLAPRERAQITLALHETPYRDALLGRWVARAFDLDDVRHVLDVERVRREVPPWPTDKDERAAALDRLLLLCGQVPAELSAPLLTITAAVAWAQSEGTIAGEACELALEVHPGYVMAELLDRLLRGGVPCSAVESNRAARRGRQRGRRGRGRAA